MGGKSIETRRGKGRADLVRPDFAPQDNKSEPARHTGGWPCILYIFVHLVRSSNLTRLPGRVKCFATIGGREANGRVGMRESQGCALDARQGEVASCA